MKLLLPVLLALAAVPSLACAASFDCHRVKATVEKMICQSQAVSDLDSQLHSSYTAALAAVAPSSKRALVKEQRDWIRYVRNVCEDDACLRDAYKARIGVLEPHDKFLVDKASCEIPDGNSCRSVVRYRDPAARIDSFNHSLATQGNAGRIIGCSRLIDLPVGTAHGNHSFGGLCTLETNGRRSQVMICNDDLVGHLSLQPADGKAERSLIEFTNAQCFGG